MATRKEQKEAARAQRLAEEQARLERQRRDRRLRTVGGIVIAAVVVIVVAIVVSSSGGGGGTSSGLQKGNQQNQTVSAVSGLLRGIPQAGATLGNPKAPVTMIYYGDLECPICQQFTLSGGFPQLVSNDVKAGRVKVEYRSFETATRDPGIFQTQQVAALAAGQQNLFWDYAELFYNEQGQEDSGYVTESYLDGLARQTPGLNLSRWQSSRSNPNLVNQVHADESEGEAAGVSGTPTLILEGPKGSTTPGSSVPTYAQLEQAIKSVA